jgi:S-adenosylmethionine decarboxylase
VKDLAPDITRQRLLIEGLYASHVDEQRVREYLLGIARELGLRTYGDPIVHSPQGAGREENEGFDAFVPLIDSGIALYIWTANRFFSTVIYTCKSFDSDRAIRFTDGFFGCSEIEAECF